MKTNIYSLIGLLALLSFASRFHGGFFYQQSVASAEPRRSPFESLSLGGVKIGMDSNGVGRLFGGVYHPANGWSWFGGTHEHPSMVRVLFKDSKVRCVVGKELQIDSKNVVLRKDLLLRKFGKDFALRHDEMGESYLCYDRINVAFRLNTSGNQAEEAMIGSSDVKLFVQSGQHNVTLP